MILLFKSNYLHLLLQIIQLKTIIATSSKLSVTFLERISQIYLINYKNQLR